MPAFDFVLAGRYRLVAPLGEGGMAAVYRGRDLRLNREVAIKVLHDDLTRDPAFLARFQREAQIVASLSHPHIVPVYDVGEERGTSFIVMEYVRGRTLKDEIERHGRLPADRARDIMLPVLDALAYAHQRGLIHRDVKPHNILLSSDGTPRLADFGIAHLNDGTTTRTAAILGSAHYLSPEQSRGEEATVQSDIYACGIVLYEMLTGAPPFDGPNALAIANLHLHADAPALQGRGPEVSPELDHVVQRALAKNPTDRYADAIAFTEDLQECDVLPEQTSFLPLPLPDHTVDLPLPTPQVAPSFPLEAIALRRSARKSYLLAVGLMLVVAAAIEAANLPVWGRTVWGENVPPYPAMAYAVLPALALAAFLFSWLNARSWTYLVDGDVAVVQRRLLAHRRLGIPLTQISTLELQQSLLERVLGVGTVALCARDPHGHEQHLVMEDIPHPHETYSELTKLVGRAVRSRGLSPHPLAREHEHAEGS